MEKNYIYGFAILAVMILVYAGIAGLSYSVFYKGKELKYIHKKIQQKNISASQVFAEIQFSLSTLIIYTATGIFMAWLYGRGLTRVYTDLKEYGLFYFFISPVIMILLHDMYFYWMHRLMHLPRLFPLIHKTHHRFKNPSPWAAFAFHPAEAFIEAGIIPLLLFTIPCHPIMIGIFLIHMTVINILGHAGYELYPAWFKKHPLLKWLNTSTHHNRHHEFFTGNYGLYYLLWDKIMRTLRQ